MISSTLLNLSSTFFLSFITILAMLITFKLLSITSPWEPSFHVPDYYVYSIPIALVVVLIFLNYFGFRFGFEARKRGNALNRLWKLAKEQELDTIGHQAALYAHSFRYTAINHNSYSKTAKKELSNNKKYNEDIDTLLDQ